MYKYTYACIFIQIYTCIMQEEIPRDQQRLICGGKPLEVEDASLEALGIAPGKISQKSAFHTVN